MLQARLVSERLIYRDILRSSCLTTDMSSLIQWDPLANPACLYCLRRAAKAGRLHVRQTTYPPIQ